MQQVTTRQQGTDAKAWQTQDINNTNDSQKKYGLGTVSKTILLEGLNPVSRRQPHPWFWYGPGHIWESDKTQHTHDSQEVKPFSAGH